MTKYDENLYKTIDELVKAGTVGVDFTDFLKEQSDAGNESYKNISSSDKLSPVFVNHYQKWKTMKDAQAKVTSANQAYLDTKTALLNTGGRTNNLLANSVQGITKLLGKSVL